MQFRLTQGCEFQHYFYLGMDAGLLGVRLIYSHFPTPPSSSCLRNTQHHSITFISRIMPQEDNISIRYRRVTAVNRDAITPNSSTDPESETDGERASTPKSDPKDGNDTKPEPETLLYDDPFSSETSKQLFNAIDELRKCGAGQILDLPQVCASNVRI
jgi:hypothetical protein